MRRRTKTIGIAVAMALMVSVVVGVASASAAVSVFEAPAAGAAATTTVKGERLGTVGIGNHKLNLGENNFSCESVAFSGQMIGETASELTVTPTLGGCVWNGGGGFGTPANWAMNGCKYRLHPGSGTETKTVGTLDIVGCEKPMTFNHEGCVAEIGNQNGLGTVTYERTEAEKSTKVIASLTGITYTTSGFCLGPKGTFSNGWYTGSWTAKGFKESGAQQYFRIHGTTAPPPTKFAAEEAPVTITGADTLAGSRRKRITDIGGNGMDCESYMLSGTSASVTAEAITLAPTYKNCLVGSETGPGESVSMGSCSYVFHVNGKFDIAGANCASKPITITASTGSGGCVTTIGPQSGLSGFSYKAEGSGRLRTVSLSGYIEGVTFTDVGSGFCESGTHSTGRINSMTKLTATNSSGELQGITIE